MQRYESYKPSGAEWLGEIPAHWSVTPAKRLFREVSEKNHPNAELLSVTQEFGVVPRDQLEQRVVMPTGQLQTFKLVREDDFVISLRSFQGGIEYSEYTGLVSPAYTILRKQKDANSRYLKHLLKSAPFISEINTAVTGIREGRNISFSEMAYSLLPLPSAPEQQKIADFLDKKTAEIDTAIAKKVRLIELLGEQKEGLISRAVLRGLRPQNQLRKSSIKWLENIPNNWMKLPCRYLFREVTRRDRDGSEQKLSVTQKNGLVPTDQMSEHSTQAQSFDEFKLCHVGDLVLNKYKAHLGVFWAAKARGIITNNYTVFQPTEKASPSYFELLFHTKWMCDQFASVVYGVVDGMMPLYTKDFYGILTICPPLDEQKEIVSYCNQVTRQIDSAVAREETAIQALRELKTTLVASYVTGKAKV